MLNKYPLLRKDMLLYAYTLVEFLFLLLRLSYAQNVTRLAEWCFWSIPRKPSPSC